ncbi:MAG TPA: TIGR00730 family Rossman fold protein [Candidatus Binatia bacterium]|nr:TIGR00730 family Rossman fold protein [Candidatus Binatia bacterium]
MNGSIRKICVFTGSRHGSRPDYAHAAAALGRELVERGYGLVYGGGNVGLMNVIANTVLECKGNVIGVIPNSLVSKEVAHRGLTELRVVGSMHERKALMAELSDGFIALPGGIGTMEEFFEVLSWAQLGLHQKPCGILNVSDYYDALIQFLDHAVADDFLKPKHRALMIVEREPAILLDRFEQAWRERSPKPFDPATT